MSSKRKSIKQEEIIEEIIPVEDTKSEQPEIQPEIAPKLEKPKKETKKQEEKGPKYKIGSIVFVSRDAEADLNGFKLFPQYKKYTYTVEAYDAITGIYTLRRLNLSLKLKEAFIVAPDERAHDSLNRRQF